MPGWGRHWVWDHRAVVRESGGSGAVGGESSRAARGPKGYRAAGPRTGPLGVGPGGHLWGLEGYQVRGCLWNLGVCRALRGMGIDRNVFTRE